MAEDERTYEPDLWKKFFKFKDKGGFIALRPWLRAGKISVDIGETAAGGLVGNTLVWAPALPFAVYLRAVANDTAQKLYPADGNDNPAETYMYYGGGKTADGPVSRILKVSYWPNTTDGQAFQFKTGIFKARESATGAFLPDMKSPVSQNSIKVTRKEIAEISYVTDLALQQWTSSPQWLSELNGKERS